MIPRRLWRRWAPRIGAPLAVLGLTVVLAVTGLVWVRMERAQVADETARVQADLRDLRDTLADLRQRAAYMDAHRTRYRAARARGMIADQDRLAADSTIERLAVETGVTRADYTFKKTKRAPLLPPDRRDAGDGAAQPAFAVTPLSLTVTAPREGPIFGFIDALRKELPGYLPVRELAVSRDVWDMAQPLDAIRDGGHPEILRAEITLAWVVLDLPPEAADSESPDA